MSATPRPRPRAGGRREVCPPGSRPVCLQVSLGTEPPGELGQNARWADRSESTVETRVKAPGRKQRGGPGGTRWPGGNVRLIPNFRRLRGSGGEGQAEAPASSAARRAQLQPGGAARSAGWTRRPLIAPTRRAKVPSRGALGGRPRRKPDHRAPACAPAPRQGLSLGLGKEGRSLAARPRPAGSSSRTCPWAGRGRAG